MKPMLKKDFFSLVNKLLESGLTPELQVSTLTCWGNVRWIDADGKRQARSLYSSHDCSPLTASIHRKRFAKWFDEIIAAHHAAEAEKPTEGQKVLDGDTVRTVTAFRTDAQGCARTGIIVLDGKTEVTAGTVKPYTPENIKLAQQVLENPRRAFMVANNVVRGAIIADAHEEALKINRLVDEAVALGTHSTNPNLTHAGVCSAIDFIRASLLRMEHYPSRFIVKMMISVRRLTRLSNEAAQENYRKMLERPAVEGIDADIPF